MPSGSYRATLSIPRNSDGQRRRLTATFPTKTQALAWLRERQAESATGTLAEPLNLTVADWAARWLAAKRGEIVPTTLVSYTRICRADVVPLIGGTRIDRLTALDVRAWYGQLEALGRSAAARSKAGTVLRMLMRDAERSNLVRRNVAADVPIPTPPQPETRAWTADELRRFLAAARPDRLYPLFLLAADTGARQGELFGLEWRDVDLAAGTITIRRSLETIGDRQRIKDVKTRRARRTVVLSPASVAALAAARGTDAEPVFCDTTGGRLRPSNVYRRHWLPLIRAAGVPRIRFHDLRHTCASLLLQAGVNVKVVSERLGHADVVTTLRVYAQVMPGMQAGAAEAMGRILG